ncbi:MAG: pyridoxal phosphate-dependent aminotransferase [Clostridiales bacterium]|nr:pyridoxal phosphate-dependent aminotransferase [Clostridiales bacterium]
MIAKRMVSYVEDSSVTRAMFEEGNRLASIYGKDKVYDFSLGNPNVEPPKEVNQAIIDIIQNEEPNYVHGYMNNSGYVEVRDKIAKSINKKFQTSFGLDNIIMTCGAAGGLNIILMALLDPDDEVITFAPFFTEYRNYVNNFNGKLVVVSPNTETFQPNLEEFKNKITDKTKAVIVNTPNNPTGVVYSEDTIKELSKILEDKQKELGKSIYLISDEPYREIVYDGIDVPYLTKYYKNTIVGYSFSKSLSLPGNRIGYLVIPSEVDDFENVLAVTNIANRILGFVNAPSLQQLVVAKCIDIEANIEPYNKNRELLYNSLVEYGYTCQKPQGAFYLFVKAPGGDDMAFAKEAKKHNILVVPATSFGCPGYVRIAYCVKYETIENSLPGFKELAKEYNLN